MRKKISWVMIAVVFGMFLFGCNSGTLTEKTEANQTEPEETESGQVIGDVQEAVGVELSEKPLELVFDSDSGGVLLTEDVLITNTKKINVSITGLQGQEEVVVHLYNTEDMENDIASSILSVTNNNFTFSGLTVIRGYRIGVETTNLPKNAIIKITN